MHPYLIDWLRKIHLNPDTTLAAKRWKLAQDYGAGIKRGDLIQLLRIFLFPTHQPEPIVALTKQFLEHDKEFPASGNAEEVRLMAGVVMVAAIEKKDTKADAFALGIRASDFPRQRCKPAQNAIIDEAAEYLQIKADIVRPRDFGSTDDRKALGEKLDAFGEDMQEAQAPARGEAAQEFAEVLQGTYGQQIRRLAEETGLLWWLLGEYSTTMKQERASVEVETYSLIAAAEAAERTLIVPPPPSIYAILGRALAGCKQQKSGKFPLKRFVGAPDAVWRGNFILSHPANDCADLVPLLTALAKTNEAGGIQVLAKVLPQACPGVEADIPLSGPETSNQFYNELMFLKSLANLD